MNKYVPVSEIRRRQAARVADTLAATERALTAVIRARPDRGRHLIDARGHFRIGREAFGRWKRMEVARAE